MQAVCAKLQHTVTLLTVLDNKLERVQCFKWYQKAKTPFIICSVFQVETWK